jgi:hypothetical protein
MNLNSASGTTSAIRRGEMSAVYAKYSLLLTPSNSSSLRGNHCSKENRHNLPVTATRHGCVVSFPQRLLSNGSLNPIDPARSGDACH